MQINSPAFPDNTAIPAQHTCKGVGSSPRLIFTDVPTQAKSLALVVRDPDAPGGDFFHWVVWDMPITTAYIAEGAAPTGAIQGINDFDKTGFGAPCPPSGQHRYIFELYALDTLLNLPPTTTAPALLEALKTHILQEARLTGLVSA